MAYYFAPNGCSLGASHIGNRPEMLAMLDLAVTRMYNNKDVRYRIVLTDYDKQFGRRAS
jgi:alcohol dehydrogenase (NADP+)